MAYSETLAGSHIQLELNADGTLKAGNVEKRFAVSFNGEPRADNLVREVLDVPALIALLPTQAALLLSVAALEADNTTKAQQIAEMTAQLAAAVPPATANSQTVTMTQARLALYAFGLLETVEAHIAQLGGTVAIYWATSQYVERSHPIITGLIAALGLTVEQVDALFADAATY